METKDFQGYLNYFRNCKQTAEIALILSNICKQIADFQKDFINKQLTEIWQDFRSLETTHF